MFSPFFLSFISIMAGVSWWLQTQRLGFLGSGYADRLNHQLENHGLELGVSIWGKVANCYGRELILGTTQTSTLNLKGSNLEEISEKTRFDCSLGISVRCSGSEKWKWCVGAGLCISRARMEKAYPMLQGSHVFQWRWEHDSLYAQSLERKGYCTLENPSVLALILKKQIGIVGCSFSCSSNNSIISKFRCEMPPKIGGGTFAPGISPQSLLQVASTPAAPWAPRWDKAWIFRWFSCWDSD